MRGRKTVVTSALFPGYTFIAIELQWNAARYCPGVGIADGWIGAGARSRSEDRGAAGTEREESLIGFTGLCAGMSGRERVKVLQFLGSRRLIDVSTSDVEAA